MEIEILKKFCGTDWPEWILTPFTNGEFTYATDGHVILRVSEFQGLVSKKVVEKVEELPWKMLENRTKFRLFQNTLAAVREHFLCMECSSDAPQAKPCTKCEGKDSGEYCSTCLGLGLKRERGQKQWNTSQCPECDGTGWESGTVWCLRYGEDIRTCYFVNPKILQKMALNLGLIEFVDPAGVTKPVGFRFAGGEGLLMPMRPATGSVVVNIRKECESKNTDKLLVGNVNDRRAG